MRLPLTLVIPLALATAVEAQVAPCDSGVTGAASLLASPSAARLRCAGGARDVEPVALLRVVHNSDLPFSLDEGTLWAGRGTNVLLRAGVATRWRLAPSLELHATVAPELAHSANRPFPIFASAHPDRSAFANPFHGPGPYTADLPLRFGDESLTRVSPGQSSLLLRWRGVAAGVSTERHRWGPGVRSALVLSGNAEGFPHAVVRTAQPVRVAGGHVEAIWIAGALTESRFFDADTSNDHRAFSGAAVTYRFAREPGLTLGIARGVVSPVDRAADALGRAHDVLTRWETTRPFGDTLDDGRAAQRSDQVTSLFFRWAFAPQGTARQRVAAYGEWARTELPRSLNEFIVAPHHTQGWTVGLEWARRATARGDVLAVNAEATTLEQSITFADRAAYPDFYAGRATAQGYTHRGRVLGAATGPGSSAQWLSGDWRAAAGWRAGLLLGRIRWENDALYRQLGPNYFRHDVSLLAGLRGGLARAGVDAGVEIGWQRRLNYLFQNSITAPGPRRVVDVNNLTLGLTLAPAPRAR